MLKYDGVIESTSALPIIVEARALEKKLGIDRYLVDLTEATRENSVIVEYRVAHLNREDSVLEKAARVALLVEPDEHSHDFYETVLMNSGYNVRLFRARTLAERHLKE